MSLPSAVHEDGGPDGGPVITILSQTCAMAALHPRIKGKKSERNRVFIYEKRSMKADSLSSPDNYSY